jgi:hypothetical protein
VEIKNLSEGDIFAVVRNDRKYKFVRFSLEVKPRIFFAKDLETDKETSINLQTKIKAIKLVNCNGVK